MTQDISPNTQGATSTNTMNPRNMTAASAGSVTPTIITQSNADRRRRAVAEREERKRQSLAENVERAEVQKEYERLRAAEDAANKRAEARKESAKREVLAIYEGGIHAPLNIRRVTIADYLGDRLKGASEPIKVSEELRQFATIDGSGGSGNINAAYIGLDKFRDAVNDLLKTEAEEKTAIQRAREFATVSGLSYNQSASAAAYTPMTESARIAHQRAIENPNTSSEMKAQLTADLKRDSDYIAAQGGRVQLSAAEERNLSENWYRGGTAEQKQIAAAYLAAAGSTYGKSEFNRAQSNIYVNQTEKARDTLLQRYQARDEINNPDNTSATTAALRANQEGARQILDDLTESRKNLGLVNTEKRQLSAAAEQQYAKQDARIKELLKDNPNVREEPSRMVESILRVSDGNRIDLSSDAFFREQAATERRFGSDWTSAGGKTAEDAISDGERSTAYSRFKSAADEATEYLLIDAEGKQRYTLKQDSGGGFSIFGWTGDLVASGQSAQGLSSALKNLNVPYYESLTDANGKKIKFNPQNPDAFSALIDLKEETDITGIDTAATFKASVLGTLRTNEDILTADAESGAKKKQDEANEIVRQSALSDLDAALNDSLGYSLRIQGEGVEMPQSAREIASPGIYVNEDAKDKSVVMRSDLTVVKDKDAQDWIAGAGKTVGAVADAVLFASPTKKIADGLFGKSGNDAEDAESEPDFVVFNKDSVLSQWADSLNEFGDYIESQVEEGNKLVESLSGRKAIETDYKSKELSWSDIVGSLTDPRSASVFGEFVSKELYLKPQLTDQGITDYPAIELDHITKLKRTAGKQVIETPRYAAGVINIGDSIVSSAEKGGPQAAAAAGAFWATTAGEGLIASAIKDPEGFVLDLEAGVLLGTVTGTAARPIFTAGAKVAKVGAKATGVINPTIRSIPSDNGIEFTQASRAVTAEEVIMNDRLTVGRVEITPVWKTYERGRLRANRPQHADPNDRIGGQQVHVSWGSPNPYQKELEAAGLNVNIPVSTGLFADKRLGKSLRNRILILEDVPTISQTLTDAEKTEFLGYIKGSVDMPPERQLYFHEKAQELANQLDMPVLEISPKSYNFIGGNKRPSGMSSDAENELGIVIPNNKKGMIDPKTGDLRSRIYYKLPNRRFVGLDNYYGIPIYKVSFGKNAKVKSSLTFQIDNIRDTIKDTKIGKVTIENPIPKVYSKSYAFTDTLLSEDKALKTSGQRELTPLDRLAYGEHGKEHAESVARNVMELRRGSANPEIKGMSDNLAIAMGHIHDSFKLGDKEMFIPHAQRTAFLIKEGYLDKTLKTNFNLNDAEIQKLGHAIERHTDIQPGIISTVKLRPTATDKILATADRLDLVRFGVKPNPKKLFIDDVINEPWSATSGQLLPPTPKKGTFDLNAFIEKNSPKNGNIPKKRAQPQRESYYSEKGKSFAALGGLSSAGYVGGQNAQNARLYEMLTRQNKKERSYSEKDIDTKKYDSESSENPYRESKYENNKKSSYYSKESKYKTDYGYRKGYNIPKVFGYDRKYEGKKYGGARYSQSYEILPYKYAKEYNPKNYINPGVYEMNHYDGKPYESKDYAMSGYQKKVKDIFPTDSPKLRRRGKDKKEQKKRLNYNMFTVENVEIPILRADEVLFGRKTNAYELPANKKTVYQFGNTLFTKKPSFLKESKQKTKRRR